MACTSRNGGDRRPGETQATRGKEKQKGQREPEHAKTKVHEKRKEQEGEGGDAYRQQAMGRKDVHLKGVPKPQTQS